MHSINIEIVYAFPDKVWRQQLTVLRGSTPLEVIKQSNLFDYFPMLVDKPFHYGVYSKRVDENYLMAEGDRLEIYRDLTADPKTVRREMAKMGKTMTDKRS